MRIRFCRKYALFGFVFSRLLLRHLGFYSDFAQISEEEKRLLTPLVATGVFALLTVLSKNLLCNFLKRGGSKAVYKLYKKTDEVERGFPFSCPHLADNILQLSANPLHKRETFPDFSS